ncbi:MAG: ferritin-like domain-containing protein [Pseudomonadota bacterium]|nr:MAG: ferritin-like domain-containing protein [Pseudomonadota bacterium]
MSADSLFERALACLHAADIDSKLAQTHEVAEQWRDGALRLLADAPAQAIEQPGLPRELRLVHPRELETRGLDTPRGHGALVHAICHIEFNAINLAWDAVYRFRDMPRAYYDDWVRVAVEEAGHFALLRAHLETLGWHYGGFPAHNGLWEMAVDTAHDVLVRMALVPRVLEARGLDVTPGIVERLSRAGDERAVEILGIIQRDEIGHVEIGTRWFNYLCEQRDLRPLPTFEGLLERYMKGRIRGPFDRQARLQAGFTEDELEYLEGVG